MHLKSLTLRGFKSFADKTVMVFDPGLTVVVGPNGSGKSNISDAILWVLGEQSAKQLRGQAMEDVIFSGSSARQQVNMAEVTLVLDNSDATLPVDHSEVAVTRRMYRSGESEYLINGTTCRLLDITEILHDSGLGREMHSIISQGHLDSILSSRPEERRELIEEAAGISKHRRRKARSERKLKSMDENLTRAKDIQREIGRQLRPLERQVGKARRAREVQERLREASLTLSVDDLRRLQAQHGEVSSREREAEAAVSLGRMRLEEKSRDLERYQSLLEEKGIFVGDLGAQRARLRDLVAHVDAHLRLLGEKDRNMHARAASLEVSARTAQQDLAQASAELDRVEAELSDARAEWEALKRQVDEAEPIARAAKGKRKDLGRKLAQAQTDARAAQRRSDAETLAYAKLRDQAENAQVEDELFASRLRQIEEQVEVCAARLTERSERKATLEVELAQARQAADEARDQIRSMDRRLKEAQAERREADERLARQKASLSALESVDEQMERTSPVVAALLDTTDARERVQCRLADLIGAPKELEGLVERLLGEDLTALVVAGADDVSDLAASALGLDDPTGRLTLLRRDIPTRPAMQEAPGSPLFDSLTVAPEAADMVFSLLSDVRVVAGVAEALAAHEENSACTYVTAEGLVALPDGRVVLDWGSDAERGALDRKRRIRTLREGVPVLEKGCAEARERAESVDADLARARERSERARGDVARLNGELSSIGSEMGRLEAQKRSAEDERGRVAKQRSDAAGKAEDARSAIERHKKAAEEAAHEAEELSALAERLMNERSEASRAEADADRKVSDTRLKLATVQERKNNLIIRRDDLTRRRSRLVNDSERMGRDVDELHAKLTRIEPLKGQLDFVRERVRALQAKVEDRASLAEADSESLKSTIGEARNAVDAAREQLERARTASENARVEKSRVEVQVETALSAIEAMGESLEDALTLPAPDDREALEAEVEDLRRQLGAIGPVNEVAMEEYTRLKERADFIAEQVQDLESARKSLTKITAAIERKMRRQFLIVFDQVNANFSEVFSLLFPGGSAHLELTDPDHLTETGIEIVAQPRGKRIQKMMLMSGGEKSLTALALLFAVYRTRTVPFYVFDEVEAALDDSNLGKLLDAIEELRKTTQLIVISHQRRTMEQADVLYGVSMQADGVSHVVSQRLDHTGKVVAA